MLTVGTFVCHTSYVSGKRAHVLLPEELLHEIDGLVGPRGRSAFIAESARNEVRRQKLLRFLNRTEPAWKDADHPELKQGAASWVRELRRESERKRSVKRSR